MSGIRRDATTRADLGDIGERLVQAWAEFLFGEKVDRVGVGRGGRESVDLEGARHAIEVKTITKGHELKVKPGWQSVRRKRAYAEAEGKEPVTVLVVIDVSTWKAELFTHAGFGAWRVAGMTFRCEADVRALLFPAGGS